MQEFREAMINSGITAPDVIVADGVIHRFGNNKRGWYILYGDSLPAGSFGHWSLGIKENWCMKREFTDQEKREYAEEIRINSQNKKIVTEKNYAAAALRCEKKWNKSGPVVDHPYLANKKIKAYGLRQSGLSILVPVRKNKKIISLQSIDPDGNKRFQSGGKKAGGYHVVGGITDVIFIGEGYGTMASVYEATKKCSVVAFDANNLMAVAKTIRKLFPDHKIVILGDNDQFKDVNTGVIKAKESAKEISAHITIPQFKTLKSKPTDFNDLRCLEGIAEVKKQLHQHKKAYHYKLDDGGGTFISNKLPAEAEEHLIDFFIDRSLIEFKELK